PRYDGKSPSVFGKRRTRRSLRGQSQRKCCGPKMVFPEIGDARTAENPAETHQEWTTERHFSVAHGYCNRSKSNGLRLYHAPHRSAFQEHHQPDEAPYSPDFSRPDRRRVSAGG